MYSCTLALPTGHWGTCPLNFQQFNPTIYFFQLTLELHKVWQRLAFTNTDLCSEAAAAAVQLFSDIFSRHFMSYKKFYVVLCPHPRIRSRRVATPMQFQNWNIGVQFQKTPLGNESVGVWDPCLSHASCYLTRMHLDYTHKPTKPIRQLHVAGSIGTWLDNIISNRIVVTPAKEDV